MESKKKILALFGKSGSGKDTIQKYLIDTQKMNGIISCTTRPKRDCEEDKIDYYFMSNKDFTNRVLNMSMLEFTKFNNWSYGTLIESIKDNTVNVGVFNISGIRTLIQDDRLDVLPIYIQCDDKQRLLRTLSREQNPNCYEICRRFITDEIDFSNINFNYEIFDNNDDRENFYGILNRPMVRAFLDNNN